MSPSPALVEAGVAVIERPGYDDKTVKQLREIRLLNKDGSAKKKAPNQVEHFTCPGHAPYVSTYYNGPQTTYVCTDPKANKSALTSRLRRDPPPRPAVRRRDDRGTEGRTAHAHRQQQGVTRPRPCAARGWPSR
jgi:hypothetical protein